MIMKYGNEEKLKIQDEMVMMEVDGDYGCDRFLLKVMNCG